MGRSQTDVVAAAVVAGLAVGAAALNAPTAVMAVLGIALFAASGYLLSRLLLSPQTAGLERVAVASGLALAVPILGGVLLYFSGVPLYRSGWLGLLAGVTLASDVVLLVRRLAGRTDAFAWRPRWQVPVRHTVVFAAAVVVAAGAMVVARIGVADQAQPGFTQLWLSPQRQNAHAANLGVSNDQGSRTSYRMVLLRNGHVTSTWNLTLADGGTWQQTVPLNGKYTLTANLYRLPDLAHPYRYVSTGPTAAAGS